MGGKWGEETNKRLVTSASSKPQDPHGWVKQQKASQVSSRGGNPWKVTGNRALNRKRKPRNDWGASAPDRRK